jgi:hypothetical protein
MLWSVGQVGSSDVLVILECRDRQATEDVDWIEQLASKREDVGAHLAIAVSSSGFSSGAMNLVDARGVLTRTVEELSDPELLGWVGLTSITVRRGNFTPERIGIGVPEETPDAFLDMPTSTVAWDSAIFWSVPED